MSKFNFSNVLGGAVFGSINAFLSHNASRDGYARQNRYEVVILMPSGVGGSSAADAGSSALSSSVTGQLSGETARRISFRCNSISAPARSLRTQVNSNQYGPIHNIVQGQTFTYSDPIDLNVDVTNTADTWISNSLGIAGGDIPNEGFLIKQTSSVEFIPSESFCSTFKYSGS